MMTCETPSDEIERSSSMPLMVLTASSILSVISVSICSGAAPGWTRRDGDGREVDLRKAIDAELRERERADDGERQDEDGREDRTFDAERGEPLHDQLTLMPSASCATFVVATRSPAFRPLVISIEVADRLAGRDDALLDVIAGDDEDAAGAGDGLRRAAAGTRTPGVCAGCSMRAVANKPGLQLAVGVRARSPRRSARAGRPAATGET